MLSPDQLLSFRTQGFVVVPNVFAQEELADFEKMAVSAAHFEIHQTPLKDQLVPSTSLLLSQVQELNLIEPKKFSRYAEILATAPEVQRLHGSPNLRNAINALLGRSNSSPLFLTNNAAILTLPNDPDYTYDWHKDTFYTIPQSRYLQIWAPLVKDSSVENGTLKICVGSHVNGHHGQVRRSNVPNRHKFVVTPEEVAKFEIMDVPVKIGSVLIFDQGLIHRSGVNSSAHVRYSLVGVYHDTFHSQFRPCGRSMNYGDFSPDVYFDTLKGT